MAARIPVSAVWKAGPAVDDRPGIPALSGLRGGGISHGGNRVRADPDLVEDLVCRDVVRDQSEGRGECTGAATRPGLWELSNGLDMAA